MAFLSINAVNYQDGFTDFRYHEEGVIQILARNSQQTIAVMDSSKLGKRSKKNVLTFNEVDRLLMDDGVSDRLKEEYGQKGLKIE